MDTLAIVRTHVAAVAQGPLPDAVDASLFDSGVLDSWSMMDLVSRLEQALGVKVPDSDMRPQNFESLARIVSYFDRLRSA
jgi:acyl carrier protein